MSKEKFKELPSYRKNASLHNQIINVLEGLRKAGIRKTCRGIFYILRDQFGLQNSDKNSLLVSDLITDGRLAGIIDWDEVLLNRAQIDYPNEFDGVDDALSAVIDSYRLPRWKDQPEYVEVWIEKDTFSDILAPIAWKYHVRHIAHSGTASVKCLYDASKRFIKAHNEGKECTLIYLGDHDPAGLVMVDFYKETFKIMKAPVKIDSIAITANQARANNLKGEPLNSNPHDRLVKGYIDKTGEHESWELDFLPSDKLEQILTDAIEKHLDKKLYAAAIEQEEKDKQAMRDIGKKEVGA